MDNIVSVKLDSRYASTLGIWQYDYGQVLRITGPELPPAVEVQFSLDEKLGETLSRVGTTVDGVTEVKIPDELLTHSATSNYRIYAYIYLTDEISGNTKYEITIPVRVRSKPTSPTEDPETDPDLFRETVVAVNASAERAKMAEQNAKESATEAGKYAASASDSAVTAEKTKEDALRKVGEKKQEAIEAIQNQEETSVGKLTTHTDGEIQRIQNQTTESKGELEQTIINAGVSKKELDESMHTASDTKTALDKSVELARTAKTELDTSTQKAGEAKTALDGSAKTAGEMQETLSATVKQAGALDTSLGEKIETGTQLKTDLTASGEKAVQDIQTAGSEQLGKMQAVAEAFTADREQVAANKEDIGSIKEDLAAVEDGLFILKNLSSLKSDEIVGIRANSIIEDNNIVTTMTGYGANYSEVTYSDSNFVFDVGDKIYTNFYFEVLNELCTKIDVKSFCSSRKTITSPTTNNKYRVSMIVEILENAPSYIYIRYFYNTSEDAKDSVAKLCKPIVINLTKHYGAGNEPSTEEMDSLVSKVDYFNLYNNTIGELNKLLDKKSGIEVEEKIERCSLYAKNLIPSKHFVNSINGLRVINQISPQTYGSLETEDNKDGDVMLLWCQCMITGQYNITFKVQTAFTKNTVINPTANEWNYIFGLQSYKGRSEYCFRGDFDNSEDIGNAYVYFRKGVAINLTKIFGEGNEPSLDDCLHLIKQIEWFQNEMDIQSNFSALKQCRAINGLIGTRIYASNLQNIKIDSVPNKDWEKWAELNPDGKETYKFGQEKYGSQVPMYTEVHGTIETDGMVSVIPKYGRFTEGASTQPYAHGGHVFEAWNKERTWRGTMVMGHYYEDEIAFQVYHPQHGQYGFVQIGNDMKGMGYYFSGHYAKFYEPIEFVKHNQSVVLTSPNGTKYMLRVNDDGTLTTSLYIEEWEFPADRE